VNHNKWKKSIFMIIVMLLVVVLSNRGRPAAAESPGMPLAPLAPTGTGASSYHIAGSVLTPTDSRTVIATNYMGCFHVTAGSAFLLNAPLKIPDGSRIVQLVLFYDVTTTATIDSWITRYNDLGTSEENLVHVQNSSTGGHGSNYAALEHVVDNFNYSYVLNVKFNGQSESLQVCGLRVLYYPPRYYYLPAIYQD
jgi:hypothetical protein